MAISSISDTARWVAAFRARESERPDALFRDPFARQLAGARGFELARRLRGAEALAWTMALRTRLLDELLLEAVRAEGCDAVLNLAAGLDTRPLRLELPPALRWIEADLPGILDHKEQVLAGSPAACQVERLRVDLADPSARGALLAQVGGRFRKVVVLTEGLLVYLPHDAVAELSRALHDEASVAFWMMDAIGPLALLGAKLLWNAALAEGDARMQFAAWSPAWFAQHGWTVHREALFADAAVRLRGGPGRRLWGAVNRLAPRPLRELRPDRSGVLWLQR